MNFMIYLFATISKFENRISKDHRKPPFHSCHQKYNPHLKVCMKQKNILLTEYLHFIKI
jgi:hypothetical protein